MYQSFPEDLFPCCEVQEKLTPCIMRGQPLLNCSLSGKLSGWERLEEEP